MRGLLCFAVLWALVAAPAAADDLAALNAAGVGHYQSGRFEEAIEAFERALVLAPGEATVMLNLERSRVALGLERRRERRYSDAADCFRKAADALPESLEPRVLHAEALAQLDRVDDGISVLEEALRLLNPTADAVRALGFLYYRSGRREEALRRWRQSLELDPDQPELAHWIERVEREAEVERNFSRSGSSIFQVSYDAREHPELAGTVLTLLEEAFREVNGELGLLPRGNIDVVLLGDTTFREVNEVPNWVGGLYDGRIKFPVGNLSGDADHLRKLARHELTHALLAGTGRRNPGWLEEGLAQMMEGGDATAANATVREATRSGRSLGVDQLGGSFVALEDRAQVTLAYAQSLSFCSHLRERYGRYPLRVFLDRLSMQEAEPAFEQAFGAPLATVEAEWRRGL